MRVKVDYRSTSKEVYDRFCKAHPEVEVTFDKWRKIVYQSNYEYRDYILETGEKLKLPWGFGALAISKKKRKRFKEYNGQTYINLAVDWKATKEQGKTVYHFNSHTDGFSCKWWWFMGEARFFQSDVWNFKPSRVSSRKITEYLNNPSKSYIEYYKEWKKRWRE